LKSFDPDPVTGKPILLKDGRFGPYVTDGSTNATVPRGTPLDSVDFEIAAQLIAEKRAKGPSPARAAKKKSSAKKPAKRNGSPVKKPKKSTPSKSGVPAKSTQFESSPESK